MKSFQRVCQISVVAVLTSLLVACGGGGSSSSSGLPPLPFARDGYYVTSPDTPVTGHFYASSPVGAAVTYAIDQQPAHGKVTLDSAAQGTFTYTPTSGYTGTDSFTFVAKSTNGTSPVATMRLAVNGNPPSVSALGERVEVTPGTAQTAQILVRLSNPANGQATVDYATADGTAKAGTDYTATSGTLTFSSGQMSQTIDVKLLGASGTSSKAFTLKLSNPSSNIQLGTAKATVVLEYYPEPLNDTGITGCGNASVNASNPNSCPQSAYPGQDAQFGRDAAAQAGTLAKVGSGIFGFDFVKIGPNGKPLFNQGIAYSTHPWACLKDERTGLEWEVPTPVAQAGLFDSGYEYTWYNPNSNTNGGDAGTAKGGPYLMDTYHFVQLANSEGLCGHTDWRLPTVNELRGLLNYGATGSIYGLLPSIPTLESAGYWTSTPGPNPGTAYVVSAINGYDSYIPDNSANYAILVRGGS